MGLHVASELIRAREALVAVGEVARMGLLAGVGANVAGLVLEAEEGFVTEMALVRARDTRLLIRVSTGTRGRRG